jgi:hypothetical protein
LQSSEAIEARRKAEQAKLDELRAKVCPNPNTRTLISEVSCACYEILVPLFSRCA